LDLLSKELNWEVIPQRIECYDISHLAGEETVGSMVVFTNGSPDKSCYRRFKITQDQNNDFASLAETIKRRFNEARKGNPAFLPEPDLIIIDGGLGQVNAVNKILNEADLEIPLFSLAKQEEVIYQPNNADPIKLGRNNEALKLLQRLRDEAHRFAIEYNRQRRQKKLRSSSLDKIPNIGPQRKKALLAYFGSARKVKEAELAELEKVPGFSKNLALNIYQYFHQDNDVSIQE
jgi:excinuclease ABC subunit C